MRILGVTLGHDTSFALVVDGSLEGVLEAERYFRQKRYKLHCISMEPGKHPSGYQYYDVDELRQFLAVIKNTWGSDYDAVAVQNQGRTDEYENYLALLKEAGIEFKSSYSVDHHLSHAALAFYTSPFTESLVLSYDGQGNDGYSIVFKADSRNGLEYLKNDEVQYGRNYSNLGFMIGVKPEICGTTSGKVMGLAAYGELREDWLPYAKDYVVKYRKFEQAPVEGLKQFGKGHRINSVALHDIPELSGFVTMVDPPPARGLLNKLKAVGRGQIKELRIPDIDNPLSMSLARTVQAAWTKEVIELLRPFREKSKNLCIVGGCALNGITNYVIQEEGMFEHTHMVPNPSDCGLSAGAALYVNYHYGEQEFSGYGKYFSPYLGVEPFDKADLPDLKKKYPNVELDPEETPRKVAALISKDLIVGVIRGRYEIGPRALGNRSILCNPVNRNMRDILNSKVKHREWYRPFAPMCTAEDASKFFTNTEDIPYMSVICYTRDEYKEALPSITHVDGSARLQTVTPEQNEFIHATLREFGKISGYPIILNTSFNPRGEPILNYCHVALEMLDSTDMDLVLIENTLFCKKGNEHLLEMANRPEEKSE